MTDEPTDDTIMHLHEPAEGWVPKAEWGDGPWQTEPDELAWSFGDVACRIVRHPKHGSLNGYVGVPPSHPWYGIEFMERNTLDDVVVHGGVTFTGEFAMNTFASRTDRLWWVGFDCGHFMDVQPGLNAMLRKLNHEGLSRFLGQPAGYTYRTFAYVKLEVESLARQAIAATR